MIDTTAELSVESEQQQEAAAGVVEEALARLDIGAPAVVDNDEPIVESLVNTTNFLLLETAEATLSRVSSSSETGDRNETATPERLPSFAEDPWPVHLGEEGSGLFEPFSDDELVAALQTLGFDDDDNDNSDPLDFPSSSEDLPELEFTGDDDPLLISFVQNESGNIFDVFDEGIRGKEQQADPALDILEQLEHLKLLDEQDDDEGSQTWLQPFQDPQGITPSNRAETQTAVLPRFPETTVNDDDGLSFIFCQPCNSPSAIPPPVALPYSEDQAWAIAAAAVLAEHLEEEGTEDLEDDAAFWREQIQLLQSGGLPSPLPVGNSSNFPLDPFELLRLGDGDSTMSDEVDPIVPISDVGEPAETGGSASEGEATKQFSLRPEALIAAFPFATSFGTFLTVETAEPEDDDLKTNRRPSQRQCLGHKERVLGCDFSSCGKYLATASQDSTVRVWSTATNRQLSVLQGHSTEHECLRVAWASPAWAQDQIQRRQPEKGKSSAQSYAYLLASGGADGVVHLWGSDNPDTTWTNYATLDHSTYNHVKKRSNAAGELEQIEEAEDEADREEVSAEQSDDDKPQIYSLQFIDHWTALPTRSKASGDDAVDDDESKATNSNNSFLLTSSDDHVHLWEIDEAKLNKKTKAEDGAVSKQLHLREILSLRFGPLHGPAYGVTISPVTADSMLTRGEQQPQLHQHDTMCPNNAGIRFGGDRNPANIIYVFDASYCPANGLLGAALSDGSLRLMNGRGVCLSVLQLPGCQSHLTSFSWDSTGERLATTVATGHLITWGVELINTLGAHDPNNHHSLVSEGIRASCRAVMEGGHERGRPLYGTRYLENDDLLISWGGDGRVCLWDSRSDEEIDKPLAILWDNGNDEKGDGYPVYALSVTKKTRDESSDGNVESRNNSTLSIAIAGGGTAGGFLGIPVYLQDVFHLPDDDDEEVQGDAKRPKQDE